MCMVLAACPVSAALSILASYPLAPLSPLARTAGLHDHILNGSLHTQVSGRHQVQSRGCTAAPQHFPLRGPIRDYCGRVTTGSHRLGGDEGVISQLPSLALVGLMWIKTSFRL